MRWVVGEFDFDVGSKLLRSASTEAVLEPKAAALLAFFCQNADRDISRDELLTAVWHGQVVSDNSINRVIVLLRKALGDDEKARRYIATIPKFGYRFIAHVKKLEPETPERTSQLPGWTAEEPRRSSVPIILVALVAVASVAVVLVKITLLDTPPIAVQPTVSVTPLSRLAVPQRNADLAVDGVRLLYTADEQSSSAVFMASPDLTNPLRVSPAGGSADFAKWANNDEFAVYLFVRSGKCEFHRVRIENQTLQPHQIVYQSATNCYSEFSFSPDNTKLYFVERANSFSPYMAYELDLENGTKRRLSQPVAVGLGNHFIDAHPVSGKLLLLSDQAPGKTSVYELDVALSSFTRLKEFDYSVESAIWGHKESDIVHSSMHPSYQLISTSLTTDVSQVIVSDSRRISSPRRLNQSNSGKGEYLFTSYLYNRDIRAPRHPDAQLNSAVMDYLPALSPDGSKLAFISKRNGYSQIFIATLDDNTLTVVEPKDKGRLYFKLAWSADGLRILANSNTGAVVYDAQSRQRLYNVSFPLPAYAVSWASANSISYSHYEDNRWHAFRYDLDTNETTNYEKRWAFMLSNEQVNLKVDQNLNVFRNGVAVPELKSCASTVWRYDLQFELDGEDIYCHAKDGFNDLLKFDREMNEIRLRNTVERFEFFTVAGGNVVSTEVVSAYSDIMKTNVLTEQ